MAQGGWPGSLFLPMSTAALRRLPGESVVSATAGLAIADTSCWLTDAEVRQHERWESLTVARLLLPFTASETDAEKDN